MARMKVNGATLHVEDSGGPGPPVLFAHGFLWSTALYRFQVASFADRYRCVAFDFRGQGRSEITAGGYDIDTLTEDAVQLVEQLDLAPVHFVGLSMGGFVGMRVAARRPELVRSLALLNTAADGEPRANLPRFKLLALVARVAGLGVVAGRVMRIMFGSTFLADPERRDLREGMRRELIGNRVTGTLRALRGVLDRPPVEEELERIRTPTLVIVGGEDAAIDPARSRAMADRIAGARLVAIPRAGHTSTIEEPEAVNDALGSFWASVDDPK